MKVLLHCCCAPCSLSCIEPLKEEKVDLTAFWYNPNIHESHIYTDFGIKEKKRNIYGNYRFFREKCKRISK